MLHGYWLRTLGIDGAYELADVAPADYPAFLGRLRQHGYVGCNVTVPHKEAAFGIVARRDAAAEAIGAVNTVWYEGDDLVGGNTDAYGFLAHLDASLPGWDKGGGSRRGARRRRRGPRHRPCAAPAGWAPSQVVNRSRERAEALAGHFGAAASAHDFGGLPALLADADLLVNTTSLGMIGHPPLDLDLAALKPTAIVYDIVYVPLETELLKAARARGHRTVDGLGMLLHQARAGLRPLVRRHAAGHAGAARASGDRYPGDERMRW